MAGFASARRAVWRGVCIAAIASGALAYAAPAHAAPSARLVYLRGQGADSCPDEAALRAAVAARLGYDPFFPWAPDTVFAEVVRTGGAWRANVKLVDDASHLRGSRELRVAKGDCAAAIDAMALSISLAIDPNSLLGPKKEDEPTPPPTPPPTPTQPPTPTPTPTPTPPPPPPPPSEPFHLFLGLGALAGLGSAPAPNFGAFAFSAVRYAWWSAALEVRGDFVSGAPENGAYVRSNVIAASVVPCAHAGIAFGCAVASAGVLRATSAVAAPRESDAAWAAAGVRGGVLFPLGGSSWIRAHAEVLGVLTQPKLSVDGVDVFTYAPASGDVGVAFAVRFR